MQYGVPTRTAGRGLEATINIPPVIVTKLLPVPPPARKRGKVASRV